MTGKIDIKQLRGDLKYERKIDLLLRKGMVGNSESDFSYLAAELIRLELCTKVHPYKAGDKERIEFIKSVLENPAICECLKDTYQHGTKDVNLDQICKDFLNDVGGYNIFKNQGGGVIATANHKHDHLRWYTSINSYNYLSRSL